jgi:4a-hydroxytetrahydrobiopterin dehydratase
MGRESLGMPERRKLDDSEITSRIADGNGWTLKDGKLFKRFEFESYKSGLVFAVAIGQHADRVDHHPDLFIGYQYVEIGLNTHDVGGISTYDFMLAEIIEGLV